MGLTPLLARVRALLRRAGALIRRRTGLILDLLRPRPVRGVATTSPDDPLSARDRQRLRRLGFIPAVFGGAPDDESDSGDDDGGENNDSAGDDQSAGKDPDDGDDGDDPGAFDRDYVAQLRREAARYRERAKRAEQALAEREHAGRSDAERLEAANQQITELQAELWRTRAAVRHSIPEDLVDMLVGDSEDEVMDRAERLARRITDKQRSGLPRPERGAKKIDPPSLADQIAEAEARGDWARAGQLKAQQLAEAARQT